MQCPHCGLVREVHGDLGELCPVDGTPLKACELADRFIGRVLAGRFRVDGLLGSGGMGAVFRARQLSVDREVAVKVLHAGAARDPDMVERFLREARATSRLRSDHTITIHDFGEAEDGVLFLAMEHLQGRTLRQRLAEGPLAPEEALGVLDQVTESLGEAHAAGIVHRDVKPSNVFLEARPGGAKRVKVLDFGVARVLDQGGVQGAALTAPGTLLGSVPYMAPEVVGGQPASPASDVYALGVLLFEALAGRRPFRGRQVTELLLAHVNEAPPDLAGLMAPHPLRDRLATLVGRCLDKNPLARPRDATALRQVMAQLQDDSPSMVQTGAAPAQAPAPGPGRSGRDARVAALVAAAAMVCAAVGALLPHWMAEAPEVVPAAETAVAPMVAAEPTPAEALPTAGEKQTPAAADAPASPPPAAIEARVTSSPPGAEVRDGETVLGTTPVSVRVPPGQPTTLVLTLAGHAEATLALNPAAGDHATRHVELSPLPARRPRARAAPEADPIDRGIEVLLEP